MECADDTGMTPNGCVSTGFDLVYAKFTWTKAVYLFTRHDWSYKANAPTFPKIKGIITKTMEPTLLILKPTKYGFPRVMGVACAEMVPVSWSHCLKTAFGSWTLHVSTFLGLYSS